MRRSRATTLLNTDDDAERRVRDDHREQPERCRVPRIVRNALLSAMPVTMPGSAIGRMTSKLTRRSRPKNR